MTWSCLVGWLAYYGGDGDSVEFVVSGKIVDKKKRLRYFPSILAQFMRYAQIAAEWSILSDDKNGEVNRLVKIRETTFNLLLLYVTL